MHNDDSVSYAVNGIVALLLTFFFGPLGAFFSWWLLCGFGLWNAMLKTLAYIVLYAFVFGICILTAVLFAPMLPFLVAAEIPIMGCLYLVLQIILMISVYKSAVNPRGENERE